MADYNIVNRRVTIPVMALLFLVALLGIYLHYTHSASRLMLRNISKLQPYSCRIENETREILCGKNEADMAFDILTNILSDSDLVDEKTLAGVASTLRCEIYTRDEKGQKETIKIMMDRYCCVAAIMVGESTRHFIVDEKMKEKCRELFSLPFNRR